MRITAYEFGKIQIEGKTYSSDVIITPDRVHASWWRKEGHRLLIEDLDSVIDVKSEVLVVGTGYYGRMSIPDETRLCLQTRGIRLVDSPTDIAVKKFNSLLEDETHAAAALHLTC
jgi:hypothetical protein